MNVLSMWRFVVWAALVGGSTLAMAASPTWTFVDAYQADWPVAVSCPDGTAPSIDASTPSVQCVMPSGGAATFSVKGVLACTANFDAGANFVPATSTCKPAATAGNTLTFAANLGVFPSVLWTFNDSYAADLAAGVAVACPNGVTGKFTSTNPSVSCAIPANGVVTFTLGEATVPACTANFDANSQYLPATSTCQPVSFASDTLVFSGTQGVAPPAPAANTLAIGFAGGGVAVSCVSGACGTLSATQVVMAQPMSQNGAMTLGFATGSGSTLVSCNVAFFDNFLDDRNTTCQGVDLVTAGVVGAAQQLTFPTTQVGSETVGVLQVFPAVPASASGTAIGNRNLTFVNQCSVPVWFGLVSGTVGSSANAGSQGSSTAGATLCANGTSTGDSTCPVGSTCRYVDPSHAFCFYDPADPQVPQDGNRLQQFMLAAMSEGATPASSSVSIPVYAGNSVVFSGGASARVGCQDAAGNFVQCAVGNCNDDDNALGCGYTNGTDNGATIAEFTLQAQAMDFYDISIINGAHVPMKMAPSSGQTPDASQQSSVIGYYWCGAPGAASTVPAGQPACDWNLASHLAAATAVPAANAKSFVSVATPAIALPVDTSAIDYCTADSDCASSEVCGLSLGLLALVPEASRANLFSATGANGKSGPYTCGAKLGYSTPVDICSLLTTGDDGFLHCNTALTLASPAGGNVDLTNANLYACNGNTDNCVKAATDYSGTVCCGCTTWSGAIDGVISGMTDACTFAGTGTNSNAAWAGTPTGKPPVATAPDVLGKIGFLKQACPTAYAYQFDDATSTFNCYVDGTGATQSYNMTDYTITFCPDGNNGD